MHRRYIEAQVQRTQLCWTVARLDGYAFQFNKRSMRENRDILFFAFGMTFIGGRWTRPWMCEARDRPGGFPTAHPVVCLVYLVSLVQPNKPDRPNRPERPDWNSKVWQCFTIGKERSGLLPGLAGAQRW